MYKNAFVHIGFPKTGTTSIQSVLASSREILRVHGVNYPGQSSDHADLIARFHPVGTGHYYFAARQSENLLCLANQIIDEALSFEGDLILSTEYLHNMGAKGAKDLFETLSNAGFATKFICYVRHPVDDAVSSAQQAIKMGSRSLDDAISSPKYTKIKQNLSPIVKQVGARNIILREFRSAIQNGLLRDFMSIMDREHISLNAPKRTLNESISMDGALLADLHRNYQMQTGELLFPKKLIFLVGGKKFDLPEFTKDCVRSLGQEDLEWVQEKFGVELEETVSPNRFRRNITCDSVLKIFQHFRKSGT